MVVTLDEKDFLAEWRESRIKDVGFLAIFTVFGSVLSFFAMTLAKQIVRSRGIGSGGDPCLPGQIGIPCQHVP